jgi:myo-inositol-1(or 4)-monophosphatase
MTSRDQKELLTFAKETALGAGDILKRSFNRSLKVRYKGRIDPVTDVDVKAERYITRIIRKKYPRHDILAEEGVASRAKSTYQWVVDPIDGTVNFTHGFPVYCVSIGLLLEGRPYLGAVYDPERDEMFWGVRGGGAWLNKNRIHVTSEKRLERALLATGFAYDIGTAKRNNLGYFARMAKKAQGIRRPGSAAIDLCWLASGRIDGFWELKLHPWDTAAAVVLVEEAGGKITRTNGKSFSIFDKDILASNGHLHRGMKAALHGR